MKQKVIKVYFVGGATQTFRCHDFVINHALKMLYIYPTENATAPSKILNFANITTIEALTEGGSPSDNPLNRDEVYDDPLN